MFRNLHRFLVYALLGFMTSQTVFARNSAVAQGSTSEVEVQRKNLEKQPAPRPSLLWPADSLVDDDASASDRETVEHETVADFSEEFKRTVISADMENDGREEKLKLRPEIFFQTRYSFQPRRAEDSESGSHFSLTQLELGWSGRISRRFGASFEVQVHSVINGEPRDFINDAFIEYYLTDHATLTAGQVTRPFGFDAQQSNTVRESPERAMFVGYFFPGEHDRGVIVSGNLDSLQRRAFKDVTYSFAVFRGNVFLSREKPQINYVARVRKVFAEDRLAFGVSVQQGKQHLPEDFAGTSNKNIFGVDFQYRRGRFGLRGEFAAGDTPSSLYTEESISGFRTGAHSAGGALFVVYRLTRKSSGYARYDQFNGDPAAGRSIRAVNFGYLRQVGKFSRLSFDYQIKNRSSFNEDAVNDKFQINWSMVF